MPYFPRSAAQFLHHIVSEVAKPIAPDDLVHLEYVPTQVVAEFLRHRIGKFGKLDGIAYTSSVHPSGVSYVLFAEQANIEDTTREKSQADDVWLRLVSEGELAQGACSLL